MITKEIGRRIIVKLDIAFLAEDDRFFGNNRPGVVDNNIRLNGC